MTRLTRNSNLTRLDELQVFGNTFLLGRFGEHDEARTHLLDPRRLPEDRLPAMCGFGTRFVVDNWREERGVNAVLDNPDLCGRCRQVIARLETP